MFYAMFMTVLLLACPASAQEPVISIEIDGDGQWGETEYNMPPGIYINAIEINIYRDEASINAGGAAAVVYFRRLEDERERSGMSPTDFWKCKETRIKCSQ